MLILLKRNSNLLTWLYYMKSSIAEQKRGGREKKSMKLETVLLEQALVVSTLIKADSTLSQHYATAVILKKLQHILSLHYC